MVPGSEMKERIMETAFELFTKKGYDSVSLNMIVEKAEVSKGGLFHHFDSKYTLARDTLMWWARTHMEPEFFEKVDDDLEPRELLIYFIDFMLDLVTGDIQFTRFFWSVFDESIRKQEDPRVWIDFLNAYVQLVGGIYEKMGVKDPWMKAMVFLSNLDGMALYYAMLKQTDWDFDVKALREELIRTYVDFDEEVDR